MPERAYAKYYHQPVAPYPDIRDVSGLILEAGRQDNYDFMERLQAQIVGGVNGNNINAIKNRLDNKSYPLGWPEVRIFKGYIPDTDPDAEPGEKEEMEVPEMFLEAFPCAPMRIAGINARNPDFPIEELTWGKVRSYALAFGTDVGMAVNGIEAEIRANALDDSIPEEEKLVDEDIDNVFFSPTVRLWDVCEPAKHYLFDFFKNLHEEGITGLSEEEQEQTRGPDGSKQFKGENLTAVTVRHEEVYNQGIRFAYLNLYDLDWGDINNPETVFYYNADKFTETGELKEEYYASTIDLYLTCGYIAYTFADVRTFMQTGEGVRAKPLVPDSHPRRQRLRVDNPVRTRVIVNRPEGEDGTPGVSEIVTELLPGRTYERIDENTLEEILPEIQNEDLGGVLEGEVGTERIDIRYYRVHEGGVEVIRVVAPQAYMNTVALDDEEEYFGLVGGAVSLENINEAAVPFFPAIVAEYKPHDKSDAFASSWHVTITTYEIVKYSTNWFSIILTVVFIAVSVFMPYIRGVQGALTAAIIGRQIAYTFAMFIIAKVMYGIFADDPLLAALVTIGIAFAAGDYSNIAGLFNNMAISLPKLLMEFGSLLQRLQQGIAAQSIQDGMDEIAAMQQQYIEQQEEQNDMSVAFAANVNTMDPSLFYSEETTIEPPRFILQPQSMMDAQLNFNNIGFEIMDVQRNIDQSLNLDLIK